MYAHTEYSAPLHSHNMPGGDLPGLTGRNGAQLAEKIALGYAEEARQGQTRLLFLRHDSPLAWAALCEQMLPRLQAEDALVLQLDLAADRHHEPYFPCLSLARLVLSQCELDAAEVCASAELYPAYRGLFASFLRGGVPQRVEEPIIDEIDYERERMLFSLQALLVELARSRPLVLLLDNLQEAQIGLWRLLLAMLRAPEQGRILVIAGFSASLPPPHEDDVAEWDDVVSALGEYGVVVALDEKHSSPLRARKATPAPEPLSLDTALEQCRAAVSFLAFEEAIRWTEQLSEPLQEAAAAADPRAAFLLGLLGDAHHNLHEADEALIHYEHMLQVAQECGDDALQTSANRRLAIACVNKHDISTAVRFGQHAINCARRTGNEALLFQALLALFIVEDKFTRTLDDALYAQLLQLGRDHAGPCTQIYMLNMSYLYLAYYEHDFQELLRLNEQALQLASESHNEFALAVGYHKRSIIHGLLDDNRNSLECLRQSEAIRSRLGNKLEVVRACNGIGFLCLMQDDYRRAFDYFTKAMQLFGTVRDYNEISMTLYNLASLYYRTGQFSIATHILDKAVQIMGILGITHIPFRDIASIYALKGICHFRSGNWIKGTEWLSRIQSVGRTSNDAETRCYVGLLECHAAAIEHDVHRINAIYADICTGLSGHFKAHQRILPWAAWELALLLRRLGYQQNAQAQFEQAINLAEAAQMRRLAGWIRDDLKDQPRQEPVELPELGFDLEALVTLARQEVTLKKLRYVVRNMNFLNSLQSLLNRNGEADELAHGFLRRILGFCPAQLAALHVRRQDEWQELALISAPSCNISTDTVKAWLPALQQEETMLYSEPALLPDTLQGHGLQSLINLRQGQRGQIEINLLVACTDAGPGLDRSEKQVLDIALGQLASVLEKLQHQNKLLYLSTIDELTGLANRKALRAQLKQELARVERYRDTVQGRLSAVFIDLDNFKYYNDSFGHAIGDLLLKSVADLLRSCIRDTDFLARYGGDEFVLLLPETDAAQALQLMQRIVDLVGADEQWLALLAQAVGHEVSVPQACRLGCSVGIAPHLPGELELDLILQRADQALYAAKKSGKNQARIWRPDTSAGSIHLRADAGRAR